MKIEQSLILIDGTSRIEAPKTERSRRIVDLDVATLEALRAHKKAARRASHRRGRLDE